MGKRATCGLALAASALLLGAAGTTAATGPSTIRITDVQQAHRVADGGPDGAGLGDVEAVRVKLYNPSVTSKSIGHGEMVCTFLDRRSRSCNGTYSLPRGKIVVGGVITSRLLYELAVVGGTGLYDNARGSLTVTATKLRPRHEILLFRLTG